MTYSKKQVLKIIQSNHEQIKTYGIKKLEAIPKLVV